MAQFQYRAVDPQGKVVEGTIEAAEVPAVVARLHDRGLIPLDIGASGDGALPLTPLGRQGNEGALARLAHKIFGGGGGGFVYFQLSGGETAALDVGALPGTDVYAPVDGTIVGISDYILDGRPYGSRIDIQPSAAPSLVVSLTHLSPDPALTVGSTIAASSTKVGRVVDLSGVETQALSRYTQDAGNHVAIELRAAANLLP